MTTSTDYLIKVLADTKNADSNLKQFSKRSALVGAGLAAAGVAAAAGLYKIGETFTDVENTIRVGTGATGAALDGLVDVAKDVGKEVPASFDQIAPVVADLNTRLGLSGDTLETVASQYLEAGRILGEDVDIQGTTAAFTAFGVEGDAVSGAMDTLFQISQATGVGLNELAAGAQANAPALQALGFGFEDAVSMVGLFDKAGLNSTQIMTSMSRGLVNLAKDGEQPAEAYQRVIGELQGFIDTGDTAAALDLAGQVFGTRGASQFVGALQSGVLNMNDLMAATGATGDTILGVGEETMTFAERWQQTMNTAMVALEPLATSVFTALGDGLEAVMPWLTQFGDWIAENQWVLAAIAIAIGVVLVAAFIAWAAAIWAANVALFANPITWIILAIVALIAAVVALVLNWDQVVAWITDVWSGFISWITDVIDGFVDWWNGVWTEVGNFFRDVWEGFLNWVKDLWIGYATWLYGILDGFVSFWAGVWDGIGQVFRNVWEGLVGIVKGVWNGILGWIEGGVNGAIDLINSMIDGVNAVGGAFGIRIDYIPNVRLPRLAEGGVTSGPTLALIGDNPGGREVVEPLSSYEARLDRAYRAGQQQTTTGGDVVLVFEGDAAMFRDFVKVRVAEGIDDYDRKSAMTIRMGRQR
ncbi:phage tail tape measure protein [Microbacterium schleiferi]|uniref:Phage tail tape measure protein n=1 Tax=Microbacterium schleiferi TaxID=69362 RepID=A0A7S8MXY7_9MICO|nr:phage tail tape measure protein [Microbacterium schleiferi]QPE05314.1 phage tail tape measure protein [Microbacterium schleiferi]